MVFEHFEAACCEILFEFGHSFKPSAKLTNATRWLTNDGILQNCTWHHYFCIARQSKRFHPSIGTLARCLLLALQCLTF